MGGSQSEGVDRLRHGEEVIEGLSGHRRHRQLLEDASTSVIDQQHKQRWSLGGQSCEQPAVAVVEKREIAGDQQRAAQHRGEAKPERQGSVNAGCTTEAEAMTWCIRLQREGLPVAHRTAGRQHQRQILWQQS